MADEALLRSRGLRATRPRLAVLSVLADHRGNHLDVDQITVLVRRRIKSVSTQAVYDVLSALSRVGLARRVEPAGSPARFEAAPGFPHPHAVCRDCGAISDLDAAADSLAALVPQDTRGFTIDGVEVLLWGRCPACQADSAGKTAGS